MGLTAGVDLSAFKCAVRGMHGPYEKCFESICNWLMRGLRVDPETDGLNVHCVINRTTQCLIWELTPITSNNDWPNYLLNASYWQWPLAVLVSVYLKPLVNTVVLCQ
jgi:hypothetical protein